MREPLLILGGKVTLHLGDVLAVLKTLPDNSVDCVVTSPPYWGLRDYGVDGQIGLEASLGEHIAVMVEVFEEVRRVLKPEGTCWLNYGDCYASTPNGKSAADTKAEGKDDRTFRDKPFSTVGPIFGAKSGRPFEAANGTKRRGGGNNPAGPVYDPDYITKPRGEFTSGDRQSRVEKSGRVVAGGYLKPKDLCMIPNRLAIALQDAGWWVRSEIYWAKPNPMPESIKDRPATSHEKIWLLTKSERYFYDAAAVRVGGPGYQQPNAPDKIKSPEGQGFARRARQREVPPANVGYSNHTKLDETGRGNGRSLRNWEPEPAAPDVWVMATSPFPGAHFATFPVALAERCILAGCPKGGVVLDPFGGAGTTAIAAVAHSRTAQLIELNPEYARMAQERIEYAFTERAKARRAAIKADYEAGPLFVGGAI